MFDEGGGRAFPVAMLSRSQEKLLRYLGGFPDALAQAWDVPREVSLPGSPTPWAWFARDSINR